MTDTSLSAEMTPIPSKRSAAAPLSIMMFLQYAVWGIWLPILASYLGKSSAEGGLGFTGAQIGWILGLAGSIGAVAAPFIAGQVADRYLNAERALGILLLLGGGINIALANITSYQPFLIVSILYSVVYMPTLSLTNSIAFRNLDDPEKKFPPVRLWGTIGWVTVSTAFTFFWLTADEITNTRRMGDALTISGVISVLYAAYAFFLLPKTPPKASVAHPLAFAEAFGLFAKPAFLVVTLVALPIAMIHQCYFIRASPFFETVVKVEQKHLGLVMGIGQASEIVFLLVLGFFIKRLGYKWVLVLGAAAYAARFGIFSLGQPGALIISSQVLHGLCYGCFFAGSFLLVEKLAGPAFKHSAQTVYGIIILGGGPILGGVYNQLVLDRFTTIVAGQAAPVPNYHAIWLTQAAVAAVAMVVLVAVFPRKADAVETVLPRADR